MKGNTKVTEWKNATFFHRLFSILIVLSGFIRAANYVAPLVINRILNEFGSNESLFQSFLPILKKISNNFEISATWLALTIFIAGLLSWILFMVSGVLIWKKNHLGLIFMYIVGGYKIIIFVLLFIIKKKFPTGIIGLDIVVFVLIPISYYTVLKIKDCYFSNINTPHHYPTP